MFMFVIDLRKLYESVTLTYVDLRFQGHKFEMLVYRKRWDLAQNKKYNVDVYWS